MNHRQRFHATMHYAPRDRCPIYDFNFWDQTLPHWQTQGLPAWVNRTNSELFFGTDLSLGSGSQREQLCSTAVNVGLCPPFESRVLEDRGDQELFLQSDGVIVLRSKTTETIPAHVGHTLVDRQSWRQHYAWRLDPANPQRYPADWDQRRAWWCNPDRPWPVFLPGGSLYGWLRDWMGLEAISYLVYDDPAFFEEMVETLAHCILGCLQRILETGGRFEACAMWEDMCYSAGPLLGPEHFKKYLLPRYRRITDLLSRHGVDIVWVDCDGKIDELAGLWLEAGVNTMFPLEVGTWQADPIAFRRRFGKSMRLMGGFDKHILARSRQAIDAEIRRLAPLVEEGGYIPMPDHRVPPDVPLENYLYYIDQARRIWGLDLNLEPVHRGPVPPAS